MGVLTGFERRLEGAVEGMFARLFKSGVQPIELAQSIQRYVTDHRTVTSSGVDVPNEFHLALHSEDVERLSGYGESLPRELANVVRATARERDWNLPGPVVIRTVADDEVDVGRWKLTGRIRAPDRRPDHAAEQAHRSRQPTPPRRPSPAPPAAPAPASGSPGSYAGGRADGGATQHLPPNGVGGARQADKDATRDDAEPAPPVDLRLEVGDSGRGLDLVAGRYVIGRLATCDLPIDSSTVSREHAAVLRRNDTWWVVDLGSTNGTRVNDVRASEQPIRAGDRVKVGTVELAARRPVQGG